MGADGKRFLRCDEIIRAFEKCCDEPKPIPGTRYRCGVDLGTACVVLAVVDEGGCPVAGQYRYANVVRDGMVVDYLGAVQLVREMKESLEQILGPDSLPLAASALPPGTEQLDGGVVRNVVQSAGFELSGLLEESTAANALLQIKDGAVVDIGGGTTGISVFRDGNVIYTADEATGGTHFTLALAGARHISYEEAELYKRETSHHREILPVLRPVAEKVASIVWQHIRDLDVNEIALVGGTSCLTGIENILEDKLGIPVYKPANPLFVTPLGIALHCGKE